MITLETYTEELPFIRQAKLLISQGDDGEEIASLVKVPFISPLYGNVIGFAKRFNRNLTVIGINKNYVGNFRRFLVLHEVFHIKLGHFEITGFLDEQDSHADFQYFQNPLKRYMIVETEKEANIFAALTLFNESILQRTGCQYLQEIKDTKDSLNKLSKTLDSLRRRSIYDSNIELRKQIRKFEAEKKSMENTLEHLQITMENSAPFDSVEDIAVEYGVPPACIQCYLEGQRILGYSAIPVQQIDWMNMFNPEEIEAYKHRNADRVS